MKYAMHDVNELAQAFTGSNFNVILLINEKLP